MRLRVCKLVRARISQPVLIFFLPRVIDTGVERLIDLGQLNNQMLGGHLR